MQQPIPPPWHILSVPVCLDCPKPIDPTSKLWTSRVHLDHSLGKVTQTQYQHRHLWLTACHTPMTWGGKRPNLSQVYWSRDSYALALGKYVQKGREGWGILFIPFFEVIHKQQKYSTTYSAVSWIKIGQPISWLLLRTTRQKTFCKA